jgi:hypothetical protein
LVVVSVWSIVGSELRTGTSFSAVVPIAMTVERTERTRMMARMSATIVAGDV